MKLQTHSYDSPSLKNLGGNRFCALVMSVLMSTAGAKNKQVDTSTDRKSIDITVLEETGLTEKFFTTIVPDIIEAELNKCVATTSLKLLEHSIPRAVENDPLFQVIRPYIDGNILYTYNIKESGSEMIFTITATLGDSRLTSTRRIRKEFNRPD